MPARSLGRGRVGAEVGSRSPDRSREIDERFADRLMQPVPSWRAFYMLSHGTQKIHNYLGRFRNVVFCWFRKLG